MMTTRAAEMYVFRNMVGAYATIILIIIGIILAIIHFIKKRHDEKPMTFSSPIPSLRMIALTMKNGSQKTPIFPSNLKGN